MADSKFVPEMHDIGKLVADEILGRGSYNHTFKYFKFDNFKEPSTKTWEGVKHHHDVSINADLLLLTMADHLASGVSRALEDSLTRAIRKAKKTEKKVAQVFSLWRGEHRKAYEFIKDEAEIKDLLNFVDSDPDTENYFKKYEERLIQRPEEMLPGLNITTLFTHSELTGKLYRFLKNSTEVINYEKPNIKVNFFGRLADSWKQAEKNWQVKLLKCTVEPLGYHFRVHDLNVFKNLHETINEIARSDNVLFHTSNEFLALFQGKGGSGNDIFYNLIKPFLDSNFQVKVQELVTNLGNACPTPKAIVDRAKGTGTDVRFSEYLKYSPDLSKEISIPICEICQMAQATKQWPKDMLLERKKLCGNCKGIMRNNLWPVDAGLMCQNCQVELGEWLEQKTTEDLCGNCFRIRGEAAHLHKLDKWTYELGIKMLWTKVNLDIEKLRETLKNLYLEYLKSKIPENFLRQIKEEEYEVRFSLLSDFQKDFEDFLRKLHVMICEKFKEKNVEQALSDLFCIKIENLHQIISLLDIYNSLFNKFFKKFKEIKESPITISLICSSVKYPFFELWPVLRNPKTDVYVYLIEKGEMKASVKNLDWILSVAKFGKKTALHKLAEIAKVSEKLAEATLYDKRDRDYKTYSMLQYERPMGLGFEDILTLAKIRSD
ncbi:MAG: hypothetical protein IBX72_05920 [Nitrospirae bacterium]|nr:hypothetical protein [Nitrospirota bacterium]